MFEGLKVVEVNVYSTVVSSAARFSIVNNLGIQPPDK